MSRRPRRNHSATFKAKAASEALADGKKIAEIAQKHDVHPPSHIVSAGHGMEPMARFRLPTDGVKDQPAPTAKQ